MGPRFSEHSHLGDDTCRFLTPRIQLVRTAQPLHLAVRNETKDATEAMSEHDVTEEEAEITPRG